MAMTEAKAANLTDLGTIDEGGHFFRVWMPYLFQRIEYPSKRHAFLPLNRDYKPLGTLRLTHVNYSEMAESHGVAFKRDPQGFTDIWHNVSGGAFWLYDDTPRSRIDYFARLERLMAKSVPLIGKRQR